MNYRIFRKDVKSRGKIVSRWYYWYIDPVSGKQKQRVCKDCKTKREAEAYILTLPKLNIKPSKISSIAASMFIPGSLHLIRREQLGKSVKYNTIIESRRFVELIIQDFGELDIRELGLSAVMNRLIQTDRSASWKNHYLMVLKEIYAEASWAGIPVEMPIFQKFRLKQNKSDILTDKEIKILFSDSRYFDSHAIYLLFKLTLAAGLRISETRAFRPSQLLCEGVVLIDGFMDRKNIIRNPYNKSGNEDNPKWRTSIIPLPFFHELNNYITMNKINDEEYLFLFNNAPYRIELLTKKFNDALRRAGIDCSDRKITMHSLRYTYVTKMRSLLDADTVRKMVGHSTLKMTDYYTRPTIETARKDLLPVVDLAKDFFEN